MNNQYWRRIWVVQEILLAKDTLISCGDESFTWWNLKSLHMGLQDLLIKRRIDRFLHTRVVFESRAIKILRVGEDMRYGSPHAKLQNLLATFRNMESTDSRDKVYGLLGLVNNATDGAQYDHSEVLPIDYSKSTTEVFADTLQFLDSYYSPSSIEAKAKFVNILGNSLNLVASTRYKVVKVCRDEIKILPVHKSCELLLLGALLLKEEVIYREPFSIWTEMMVKRSMERFLHSVSQQTTQSE